jgi:hypothetical protein
VRRAPALGHAPAGSRATDLLLTPGPARPTRAPEAPAAPPRRGRRPAATAGARTPKTAGTPGRGARATGRGRRADEAGLIEDTELETIEQQHPDGMTLAQVIDAFSRRGVHLSEASFRKYVQLGLLGRSRRVGRKGRHQGSLGVYPATTVRRICAIKRMMAARYTIEDIQRSFLRFTEEVEGLRRALERLFAGFERELGAGDFPAERRRAIARELSSAQKLSAELVQKVESLERQLVSPLERAARERAVGAGQKGGVDDLL